MKIVLTIVEGILVWNMERAIFKYSQRQQRMKDYYHIGYSQV